MAERNFMDLLRARQDAGFFVCVGLDSDTRNKKFPAVFPEMNTEGALLAFNRAIIDATADVAACFKINIAFYEQHGEAGYRALEATIAHLLETHPDIPVIVDAKRGDIGNTNNGYVASIFDKLKADAITVAPYMGRASLEPFLQLSNKGIFVLVRTSNEGAEEFQDMPVETDWAPDGTVPLYQYVAFKVAKDWDENLNCGVVAGATAPEDLEMIRQLIGPDMQMLIPGVGAQGGDLEKAIAAASQGGSRRFVINLSRSVIFASSGLNFADAARNEVKRNNDLIRRLVESAGAA